jgi:hypothetical protein
MSEQMTFPLPLFRDSNEAIEFGRRATLREMLCLRLRRMEYHRAGTCCLAERKMEAGIYWLTLAQFDREAFEEAGMQHGRDRSTLMHEMTLELLGPDLAPREAHR